MNYDYDIRAVELGNFIVENKSTVRATAKKFGISKSTVHVEVTIQNGLGVRLFGWWNKDRLEHSQVETWECFVLADWDCIICEIVL